MKIETKTIGLYVFIISWLVGAMFIMKLFDSYSLSSKSAYYLVQAVGALAKQDYYKAIDKTDLSLAESENYWAYLIRAASYMTLKNDLQQAEYDYSKALKFKPNSYRVYELRGINRMYLGQFHGAIQDFTKCIDRRSTPYIHYLRAVSSLKIYRIERDPTTKGIIKTDLQYIKQFLQKKQSGKYIDLEESVSSLEREYNSII